MHELILSATSHIICSIYVERNNRKFNNNCTTMPIIIDKILAEVRLSNSLSKGYMSSIMWDFIQVLWVNVWAKVNVDRCAIGNPHNYHYRCNYKDFKASFLGCYAKNICYQCLFLGWPYFSIKSDSHNVVLAFINDSLVPWKHRSRWISYNEMRKNMICTISHIHREGNYQGRPWT